ETQKEPTPKQTAEKMAIPQEDIVFALDAIQEPVSLFEPIHNDGGDPIVVIDQVSEESDAAHNRDGHQSIKEGMYRLKGRERSILNKRFFQGKTQMEVADEIGISQAQVSRLEKAAISQMNTEMFE